MNFNKLGLLFLVTLFSCSSIYCMDPIKFLQSKASNSKLALISGLITSLSVYKLVPTEILAAQLLGTYNINNPKFMELISTFNTSNEKVLKVACSFAVGYALFIKIQQYLNEKSEQVGLQLLEQERQREQEEEAQALSRLEEESTKIIEQAEGRIRSKKALKLLNEQADARLKEIQDAFVYNPKKIIYK